ncbi:hypothetical protein EYZ11_000673 [Aspergillus tanneri]|uniref:SAP domain-containing protein n=1 Tax=Aspergillus tanneri TaxID=1220188 RepID=A0A4S3JWK0_9EURO|nr:uncharacterized protein ATNIH1004_005009 [Aspergillus tanneri]KAA8649114.1 hypothetical protein ATNIH1004_005009 [Aspergillus tanneri]THC99861.1 hypothetical protein EYZ11_000673 [Aspergillus tanneri]
MRLSPACLQSTSSWLHSLKVAQLQKIAHTTGIRSSGPKAALIQRLHAELTCNVQPDSPGRGMSILSIDMGIRNLAFAHLLVPRGDPTNVDNLPPIPILNAWQRLSVSSLPLDDPLSSSTEEKGIQTGPDTETETGIDTGNEPETERKEDFSPSVYAPHAYFLLTTLLSTYRPTHVLIERQRFRSGGASAVQEWTLRVGVFEGMLYAVLCTLARERGGVFAPVVVGVEPRRVLRFWSSSFPSSSSSSSNSSLSSSLSQEQMEEDQEAGKKKKKTVSSRDGKKLKINLVGRWLTSSSSSEIVDGNDTRRVGSKIQIGNDPDLRRWVEAYLAQWLGQGQGKKRSNSPSRTRTQMDPSVEIGKLDDLADCLVQGVTWLDWLVMRDRVSRGVGAVMV